MSDDARKLRQELDVARRTIADLQTQLENRETENLARTLELERNRSALLFMLEDLEIARKRVDRSYHEWIAALDVVGDPIFLHDKEFRILRCNKAYQQLTGLPFRQIIGQPYHDIFPKADGPLPCCLRAMGKTEEWEEEEEVVVGDTIYRSRSFAVNDEQGAYLHSVHILEDITKIRRTENLLIESERSLKEAQRIAHLGSWNLDIARNVMTWSDEIFRIFEIDQENSGASYDAFLNTIHPDDRDLVNNAYTESISNKLPYDIVHRLLMKDGRVKYVNKICETYYGEDGKPVRSFGIVHDITERKQAETALQHANRALATLSAVNRALVRAVSEDELLLAICQSIVGQRGYRMAWVGYVQHDESQSIRIMAHAGHNDGYLDTTQLTWSGKESGLMPSGRAIRSGTTQLCQDIAGDPAYQPWHDLTRERGYASSIALPLVNGEVFGVLTVYAGEINAFTPGETSLLEEMAGDLAFGVRTLHVRHERDQVMAQLQNSLEDTMQAIASIVEMRDPYTAGHQQRVAQLAAAIAVEMGLPKEQVHGIHLAGTVHDLGKIQIPAEILSKPGHLSEIEYSLIKVHPQAGYDILKNIDFPWPIAQMVLQHHEHVNGSGYPQGLKGEEILLEARILSVADVMEAMSSHRPYRPGLGFESAMEEITRNRGIYYDPQVVDACLALFREQSYSFK